MQHTDARQFCVPPEMTVRQVVEVIDRHKEGIALVTDAAGGLLGTITDGDVRRFMLAGRSLDEPCRNIMCSRPATASLNAPRAVIQEAMASRRLLHIPLIDERGRVQALATMREFVEPGAAQPMAVIMAGGEGQRLRPMTESTPKPMLEVGGRPLLETVVANLAQHGVTRIYLAVNYKADIIESHFGDGAAWGVSIRYLREQKKLGTIGALSLLPEPPSAPLLVLNGDVVTSINYLQFLEFHRRHRAACTVAASQYHISIPYGVLDLAGHFVLGVAEKPTQNAYCNAGMYVLDPEAVHLIPRDTCYDVTTLIADLIAEGFPVAAFPIREYRVDIGRKDDLNRANSDADALGLGKGEDGRG